MTHLSLRARMGLLVFAGVLPLLALNLAGTWVAFRQERDSAGRQALELARSLTLAVEGELRARIAALEVLGQSPALQEGDLAGFRSAAEVMLAFQPPGARLLLLRADGQRLLDTALPRDAALPARPVRAGQRAVLASGQPAVSDAKGVGDGAAPSVAITVPVFDGEGRPALVLALYPALANFERAIRRAWPGGDWVVTLRDGAGVPLARVPAEAPAAGPAGPVLPPEGETVGIATVADPSGAPLLAAGSRSAEFGWNLVVAVPMEELTGPALRSALLSLAAGLALLLLGLLLAHRVSRSISRPIAALRQLAAAPDGEAGTSALATGLPETDEVAAALRGEARRRGAATARLLDSERRLRLVVAELNHRAKNALATVQALALQTARGEAGSDPARFASEFGARLQTLSRAHDLLTAFAWEPAALDAVLRAGLAPWLEPTGGAPPRVLLRLGCGEVPPLASPGQAQAIVLALHELATNAAKYGALSRPEGRVVVTCRAEEAGNVGLIGWREVGGPEVAGPPARRGFGTRLLERVLVRDLGPGAQVELDFAREGVRATIRFMPRQVRSPELALAPG